MSAPPTTEKIMQTGLAFWPSKTLLSAIDILEMANHRLYPFWAHLTEALRLWRCRRY